MAKEKKPKLKVSTRLLKGRPADEIVHLAKEEDFDIIVVGSRGLSDAEELFLGSVSESCRQSTMSCIDSQIVWTYAKTSI